MNEDLEQKIRLLSARYFHDLQDIFDGEEMDNATYDAPVCTAAVLAQDCAAAVFHTGRQK